MNELELRQMFRNLSDCYADTGRFENDGSYSEGEVIQAMTEDRFIEALREAKILPIPAVIKSVCDHPQFDILGCPFDNQECEKCQYFPSQTVL
jgi:hypothetical protein